MAKELMEIGGFITEGAEIVNHDNSLSGNGTVDSPLGVVPGYNETVLWEGELGATGTDITLSESIKNFERVRFYGLAKVNPLGRCIETCEVELNLTSAQKPYGLAYFALYDRGAGVTTMNMMYIQIYDETTISLLAGNKWRDGTYTNNLSTYDFNLVKVVGINRKA
jgi:hypothetical protein